MGRTPWRGFLEEDLLGTINLRGLLGSFPWVGFLGEYYLKKIPWGEFLWEDSLRGPLRRTPGNDSLGKISCEDSLGILPWEGFLRRIPW